MKTLTLFAIAVCLWACTSENNNGETATANTEALAVADNTGNGDATPAADESKQPAIAGIKIGMKDEKVRAILGKPDKLEVLNPELGQRIEDWWYGKNQKIRMTGGQVTLIVKDYAKEQELLTKMGEAREQGDDAEVNRLMEEIKVLNGEL